jgi:hypothetical protein
LRVFAALTMIYSLLAVVDRSASSSAPIVDVEDETQGEAAEVTAEAEPAQIFVSEPGPVSAVSHGAEVAVTPEPKPALVVASQGEVEGEILEAAHVIPESEPAQIPVFESSTAPAAAHEAEGKTPEAAFVVVVTPEPERSFAPVVSQEEAKAEIPEAATVVVAIPEPELVQLPTSEQASPAVPQDQAKNEIFGATPTTVVTSLSETTRMSTSETVPKPVEEEGNKDTHKSVTSDHDAPHTDVAPSSKKIAGAEVGLVLGTGIAIGKLGKEEEKVDEVKLQLLAFV